jgi:hypothetical protein
MSFSRSSLPVYLVQRPSGAIQTVAGAFLHPPDQRARVTDTKTSAAPSTAASEPIRRMTLMRVLGSESFVEKVALLLATAVLSGFLIPYVVSTMQRTRARSDAIAASQRQLLDDLAETILTYQTLALDVSWYRTSGVKDLAIHERAFTRYNDRFVDLLATWRTQSVRRGRWPRSRWPRR